MRMLCVGLSKFLQGVGMELVRYDTPVQSNPLFIRYNTTLNGIRLIADLQLVKPRLDLELFAVWSVNQKDCRTTEI